MFFYSELSEVSKRICMKILAIKTDDGRIKGNISFFCRMMKISREGFRKYLTNKDKPWKYEVLVNEIIKIYNEDECNDTYGRIRIYQALLLKNPNVIDIPSERTVYRVMEKIDISDDLLKRYFSTDEPLSKAVIDITEIECFDGKL